MTFEIVVIGAGPAGLSAALWAEDLGLSHIVVESKSKLGGQLHQTHNPIHNHLGVKAENGLALAQIFKEQSRALNIQYETQVESINLDEKYVVSIRDGIRTQIGFEKLIVATGIRRRRLNVPGETELRGKGILASGKKEAATAENRTALVVGGGDAAFENALILSEHASKVVLVHRRDSFTARAEFQDEVFSKENIEVIAPAVVSSFNGSESLQSVSLETRNDIVEVPVNNAVIRIGVQPNSEILNKLVELDARGYVAIDSYCRTSATDVYAVGDLAYPLSLTVSTAIGSGATAVKSISSLRN